MTSIAPEQPLEESWRSCFHRQRNVELSSGSFNVYELEGKPSPGLSAEKQALLPLVVFHHGAGYTGLSFALLVKRLDSLMEGQMSALAFDCRGHDSENFSLAAMADDLVALVNALHPETRREIILVGHSMGGSVVVEASKAFNNILGVVVIDVVEGTALDALAHMKHIIATRPRSFLSQQDAIEWSVRSGTIRNHSSAKVSVPSQLKYNSEVLVWRTDLLQTQPFWEEWFQGLSEKFLSVKGARLLLLANTDRLDRTLTIGQIQGKFQMTILTNVSHMMHEDDPDAVARALYQFWKRNSRMNLPEAILKKMTMIRPK